MLLLRWQLSLDTTAGVVGIAVQSPIQLSRVGDVGFALENSDLLFVSLSALHSASPIFTCLRPFRPHHARDENRARLRRLRHGCGYGVNRPQAVS